MLAAAGCTLGPDRCCNAPVAAGVSTDGGAVFVLHATFVDKVSVEATDSIRQKCKTKAKKSKL